MNKINVGYTVIVHRIFFLKKQNEEMYNSN